MATSSENREKTGRVESRLIRYVILFSWLFLTIVSVVTWFIFGQTFSLSVFVGGFLANISFFLLKKDIEQLLGKVAVAGGRAGAVSRVEMVRFFVKFYARLIIFGLVLLVLIARIEMDMIGLSLGLATVFFSVIVVVLGRNRLIHSHSGHDLRSA